MFAQLAHPSFLPAVGLLIALTEVAVVASFVAMALAARRPLVRPVAAWLRGASAAGGFRGRLPRDVARERR